MYGGTCRIDAMKKITLSDVTTYPYGRCPSAARIDLPNKRYIFVFLNGGTSITPQNIRHFRGRGKTLAWLWTRKKSLKIDNINDLDKDRDFTLMTETPKVLKETITIKDAIPDIVKISIGSVSIFYRGTHLIGYSDRKVKYRLDSAHASPLDDFTIIHSYRELVQNLYRALAQETGDRVSEWVDRQLLG